MATRREKRRALEKKLSAERKKTIQFFDALMERAKSGDEEAETEYRREAAKLAKKVNRQMRVFEGLTRTSAAYQRAEYYLSNERGQKKFSEGTKTKNLSALEEDVEQMIIFSTNEGYSAKRALEEQQQVKKNESALREALGEIPDEQISFMINEMFKTDAWQDFKKAHGRSTHLIDQAQDAFKRGRTVDDLKAVYEEFKNSQDTEFDLTKAWKKFTGSKWEQRKNKRKRRRRK